MAKKKIQAPKRDELAENAKKARELRLSYGTYMGYVETGYIETYMEMIANRTAEDDVIRSSIGAGGSHRKTTLTGTRMA